MKWARPSTPRARNTIRRLALSHYDDGWRVIEGGTLRSSQGLSDALKNCRAGALAALRSLLGLQSRRLAGSAGNIHAVVARGVLCDAFEQSFSDFLAIA